MEESISREAGADAGEYTSVEEICARDRERRARSACSARRSTGGWTSLATKRSAPRRRSRCWRAEWERRGFCAASSRSLDPGDLTVIVNTGDDEEFFGLHVSPDLDTIVYTLGRAGAARSRLGRRAATRFARSTRSSASTGRPGSSSATATSRRTSTAPSGCAAARRSARLHARDRAALGVRAPRAADERRPRAHGRRHRRGAARLPGLPRAAARPARACARVRYAAPRGAPGAGRARGDRRRGRRDHRAEQSRSSASGRSSRSPELRRALARARERTVAVSPLIGGRAVKGPLAAMLEAMGRPCRRARDRQRSIAGLRRLLVVAPGRRRLDRATASRARASSSTRSCSTGVAAARRLASLPARACRRARRRAGFVSHVSVSIHPLAGIPAGSTGRRPRRACSPRPSPRSRRRSRRRRPRRLPEDRLEGRGPRRRSRDGHARARARASSPAGTTRTRRSSSSRSPKRPRCCAWAAAT